MAAFAEPQHSLEHLTPRGGTLGTTVSVTLHGRYLENPKEIIFYDDGIKAANLKAGPTTGGRREMESLTADFQISPKARVGEHVLRLRTATGLTEAMTFWVDRLPTVMETEKKIGENDTPQSAQSIALNTTVEGQIHPGDHPDKDYYWFRTDQGARISVEVEAVRLGTMHFSVGDADLSVRVLDDESKEVAKSDDSALYVQDPVLSFVTPRAGNYFVEITQQMFEFPRQVYYRAHIGTFTRPTAI